MNKRRYVLGDRLHERSRSMNGVEFLGWKLADHGILVGDRLVQRDQLLVSLASIRNEAVFE